MAGNEVCADIFINKQKNMTTKKFLTFQKYQKQIAQWLLSADATKIHSDIQDFHISKMIIPFLCLSDR